MEVVKMIRLTPEAIQSIEQSLNKNKPLEIKVERGKVVIIELTRKLKSKT